MTRLKDKYKLWVNWWRLSNIVDENFIVKQTVAGLKKLLKMV